MCYLYLKSQRKLCKSLSLDFSLFVFTVERSLQFTHRLCLPRVKEDLPKILDDVMFWNLLHSLLLKLSLYGRRSSWHLCRCVYVIWSKKGLSNHFSDILNQWNPLECSEFSDIHCTYSISLLFLVLQCFHSAWWAWCEKCNLQSRQTSSEGYSLRFPDGIRKSWTKLMSKDEAFWKTQRGVAIKSEVEAGVTYTARTLDILVVDRSSLSTKALKQSTLSCLPWMDLRNTTLTGKYFLIALVSFWNFFERSSIHRPT